MAHKQPPTRKSGQNVNKNSIHQPKPVKLKLPLNGEHYELPQKNKTPSKLVTNSSQIHHHQQQQQQQQRHTKLTKSLHDAKCTEAPRSNPTKGNVRSYHNYHQQVENHRQHNMDQAQSSRCMQRGGGVVGANLKSQSKLSATTTTSKIHKPQSDLLMTMKEAKAKVKPKPIAPTDAADKLLQEHRHTRSKNSNTKNFFDKYLKFAYDLTTPDGVRQLEAHFFPTTQQPQNEQQEQPDPQPGKEKSLQLETKIRNDTRLPKEEPIENALSQSKYLSYNTNTN